MGIEDVIPIEEGIIRKIFEGDSLIKVSRESIIHVDCEDERIVTIYPTRKYAEFEEEFRDITSQGPSLRPLLDFLTRNNYETDLK